eukprot:g35479.t1
MQTLLSKQSASGFRSVHAAQTWVEIFHRGQTQWMSFLVHDSDECGFCCMSEQQRTEIGRVSGRRLVRTFKYWLIAVASQADDFAFSNVSKQFFPARSGAKAWVKERGAGKRKGGKWHLQESKA